MRLPRLTTRRLMVLVALAGILFALIARRDRLLRHAQYHAARSVVITSQNKVRIRIVGDRLSVLDPAAVSMTPRRLWHTRMWLKYHHAARSPWLPVPPDPPPPD